MGSANTSAFKFSMTNAGIDRVAGLRSFALDTEWTESHDSLELWPSLSMRDFFTLGRKKIFSFPMERGDYD